MVTNVHAPRFLEHKRLWFYCYHWNKANWWYPDGDAHIIGYYAFEEERKALFYTYGEPFQPYDTFIFPLMIRMVLSGWLW